jgi:dolichyl-phosphate beta-glucosyltransferase
MARVPSVFEPASVTLSVVVPAYNEEERMPPGVDEMLGHLKKMEKSPFWCVGLRRRAVRARARSLRVPARVCAPPPAGPPQLAPQPTASDPHPHPPCSPPSARDPAPGSPPPRALPCQPFTWEILIVNDGSKDTTATVAMDYVRREGHDRVRLLNLFKNNGKGAAVRKGVTRARGQFVLMADADGATRFADVDTLLAEVGRVVAPNGEGVAIGSRAHAAGAEGKAKRSPLRRVLMWGFHTYMSLMVGGSGIKDTQCGFKLFTRPSARKLFDVLHIERCVGARAGGRRCVHRRACAGG